MTALTRSELLLHTICDLIPDQAESARIRGMDPTDHITFSEAYCAVRGRPGFTPELRRVLLDHIFALMQEESDQIPTRATPLTARSAGT